MADHFVDPALFVPASTQENYASAARMAARQNGTSVGEEWAAIIANFEAQHEADGAAGWNHLAAWAKSVDPETIGADVDPAELRKARALASAIQDPDIQAELDLVGDTPEGEAVRHAHETNRERFMSEPMSPAGSDPARLDERVAPDTDTGETDEGTEAPVEARSQRRPQRNAAQSTPLENR